MLRTLYVIAIGLMFAGFVGFGISTFYSAPESPWKDRDTISTPNEEGQKRFAAEDKQYQTEIQEYSRNLSIILLLSAVIVIAISLFGLGKVEVIGDGITLGGVILLFSGIITAFTADNEIFRFVAVTIGLAIILALSWWKFVRKPTTLTPQ